MNLMDNSVHHGKTTGKISVHVTTENKAAIIRVADDGQGIDPKIINEIFKGQLDPDDSNRFRGIGLAVCKTIVSAHGGEISAANLPGGGAEFKFSLLMEENADEYKG